MKFARFISCEMWMISGTYESVYVCLWVQSDLICSWSPWRWRVGKEKETLRVEISVHRGADEKGKLVNSLPCTWHILHCNEADEKCVFTKVHQRYFICSRDACVSWKNTRQLLNELARSTRHEASGWLEVLSIDEDIFSFCTFYCTVRYTWDFTAIDCTSNQLFHFFAFLSQLPPHYSGTESLHTDVVLSLTCAEEDSFLSTLLLPNL